MIIKTIFIPIYLSLLFSYKDTNVDVIHWSKETKLTFNDFKGKYKEEQDLYAKTHGLAKIKFCIFVQNEVINNDISFKIYAAADRNESWIKSNTDTASLIHEQGHFDICEIYARKLRRSIIKAKSLNEAHYMYKKYIKKLERESIKFDKHNSGIHDGIQKKWKYKIQAMLENLDYYDIPEITIHLKTK
ncbi:MAG TPA: hypothetical protein PKK00_14055 [Bacteroidales bacterium]|nr:hypothetical protein [Bacteroidales bacterium]HPS18318.1 hypothetical protein [Bacteroidales bacterium]